MSEDRITILRAESKKLLGVINGQLSIKRQNLTNNELVDMCNEEIEFMRNELLEVEQEMFSLLNNRPMKGV